MATNENENGGLVPAPAGTTTKASAGPRAFTQVLLMLADGDVHEQLSQEMQRLVRSLVAQSRAQVKSVKGTLSLKLAVTCDTKGVLDIRPEIKIDEPKPRRQNTIAWADPSGNVTEKNPRQVELPMGAGNLRDVSARRSPVEEDERRSPGDEDENEA